MSAGGLVLPRVIRSGICCDSVDFTSWDVMTKAAQWRYPA